MLEILPYSPEQKTRFDSFVLNDSINGTFLQTQNFLEYHPKARFQDASLFCHNSGTLCAVIPGAKIGEEFISHPGSTFGGPIISSDCYSGKRIFDILKTFDHYFSENYKSVKLKITPALFSQQPTDLLEYALERLGYQRHTELSSYIPLKKETDPIEFCNKECRRIIRKIDTETLEYRDFKTAEDFECFFHFLKISKAKYGVSPVHTLDELLDLKNNRIPDNIRFRGLWQNGVFVSAIMFFIFQKTKCIHAQYIATNPDFKILQPGTAIYIHTIREAAKEGFQNISFGISTENHGEYLNQNLLHFKESCGAKHSINAFYTKNF